MNFLGMDVGTSGCKAVVFDETGHTKGYGFTEYPIICDENLKAEQDAEYVFNCLIDVAKKAIKQSDIEKIEALAVSVQGDATMPVDDCFKPMYNMVLGMDYRTTPQCEFLEKTMGKQKAFKKTGIPIHPINTIAKILWFKENKPEIYKKAHKFMTYSDYIIARLGAKPVIDITMASRTMMMDIATKNWDKEIFDLIGLGVDKVSDIVESGTVCGHLNDDLKEKLGLKNNPIIVAGGHDQPCGAIGSGVIEEGMAVDSSGTAEVFSTTFKKPKLSNMMMDSFYPCYSHAVEGHYFTFALNHTCGIVLRWFRDNIAEYEKQLAEKQGFDVYEYIQRNIEEEPSKLFVMPHFNGSGTPTCDVNSKGTIVGLSLSTTKDEIFKGLLDGLTYELKINIDTMKKIGINIEKIRAVGGGAKSDLWMQTKANILGIPLTTLKCKEAGCLGAACLAAVGCGYYDSVKTAVDSMVHTENTYVPDDKKHKKYMKQFELYKGLYGALKKIF